MRQPLYVQPRSMAFGAASMMKELSGIVKLNCDECGPAEVNNATVRLMGQRSTNLESRQRPSPGRCVAALPSSSNWVGEVHSDQPEGSMVDSGEHRRLQAALSTTHTALCGPDSTRSVVPLPIGPTRSCSVVKPTQLGSTVTRSATLALALVRAHTPQALTPALYGWRSWAPRPR